MSIEEKEEHPEEDPGKRTSEPVEECEEDGIEALDFDYHSEPGSSNNLTFYNGKVQHAEEVDVLALRIEEANTILPAGYGVCVLDGEFKEAASVVEKFKTNWFNKKDNLSKREKMWETILTFLANTLQMDYFYYALEFTKTSNMILGSKNRNVIRQKYADIKILLFNSTKEHQRSFSKGREPRRSHSVEYPSIVPSSPEGALCLALKEYIDCRMKMIDLYLTTFQNYEKFVDWNDFQLRVIDIERPLLMNIPTLLHPLVNYFKEELSILKQLIKSHQNICKMKDTLSNLIELRRIRSKIMAWSTGFEMPENSPLPIIGRLQKTELAPKFHTALWFLKFYDFLTAKISLYITEHMHHHVSSEDIAVMHAQDNMYNFINLFHAFAGSFKPMVVAVVMDRSAYSEEPFYGFNQANQHTLYSTIKPLPEQGNAALYPYVFIVDNCNQEGTRSLSGSHSESCLADVGEIIGKTKENIKQNPISSLNPKLRPVFSCDSTRESERKLFCEHIEEDLFVVAVFQGPPPNVIADFTAFTRSLLPVLTGKGLFAEMRKLLSP